MPRHFCPRLLLLAALLSTPAVAVTTLLRFPATGVPLSSSSASTCLPSAFETPGQVWHIGLTGGGVSLDAGTLDARRPTFEQLYNFPASWLDAGTADSEIVVIDHFEYLPLKLQTQAGIQDLELSHGLLVEAHLRSLLESGGFELIGDSPLRYRRGGRNVTLTRIDLRDEVYRTKGLGATGTGAAVNVPVTSAALARTLQMQLSPSRSIGTPRHLVVSMSFAMLPCPVYAAYSTTRQAWAQQSPPRRYSLNTFLTDVASENSLTLGQVQQEIVRVPSDDPLRQTLRVLAGQRRERGAEFLAVASSGNFGLNSSTAPAAFPDVVSAGLAGWNRQPLLDGGKPWPNAADLNVAGEWFTLSATQLTAYCRQGKTCVTRDILSRPERYGQFAYRGTSFAAPTLSLFMSLQQSGDNACFSATATGYSLAIKGQNAPAFDFRAAWQQCAAGKK